MVAKAMQMRDFAREDAVRQDFWPVASAVLRASGHPTEFDDTGRIRAIYDYLRGMDFVVAPPLASQYLLRPTALYERRMGDCTAFATFVCACAGVFGYKSRLCFMSAHADETWEHVWARVYFPARTTLNYIDVDASYRGPGAKFGWVFPEHAMTRLAEVEVM